MKENKNPTTFDNTAHYFQHKFIKTDEDKLFELTKAGLTGLLNTMYDNSERYIAEKAIKIAQETLKQLNEVKL
jgi:hypothetical protein